MTISSIDVVCSLFPHIFLFKKKENNHEPDGDLLQPRQGEAQGKGREAPQEQRPGDEFPEVLPQALPAC